MHEVSRVRMMDKAVRKEMRQEAREGAERGGVRREKDEYM